MSFLVPQFLWALAALGIPLIIHLLNFRRAKTIYFSNTRLLQKVEQSARAPRRLRHWLILIARLLALAFLVLAFARPYLPAASPGSEESPTRLSIYIDNSYSMSVAKGETDLLQMARERAVNVIKSLPTNSLVQVISNDFEPEQSQFYSPNIALDLVDQLNLSPVFRSLDEIEAQIKEALLNDNAQGEVIQCLLLSDLQAPVWPKDSLFSSENLQPWYMPMRFGDAPQNLQLDSLWFALPAFQSGLSQELKMRVRNPTAQDFDDLSLSFYLNNTLRGTRLVQIKAGEEAIFSFRFTPSGERYYQGYLELKGDEAAFDDRRYFSFASSPPVPVWSNTEASLNDYWKKFFARDSLFQYTAQSAGNLNFAEISQYGLIIQQSHEEAKPALIEALNKSLRDGNNVILLPDSARQFFPDYLNALLPQGQAQWKNDSLRAFSINYRDPFFAGAFTRQPERADLPWSKGYYDLTGAGWENLLELENGAPLLLRQKKGAGQLFVLTTPPQPAFTNILRHPVAIPWLVNAALFRGEAPRPSLIARGEELFWPLPDSARGEAPLSLKTPEGERLLPQRAAGQSGVWLMLPPEGLAPGIYPLLDQGAKRGFLAVDLNRRESDLRYPPSPLSPEVQEGQWLASTDYDRFSQTWQDRFQRREWWPLALALALLFFLLEILLLKARRL